MTQTPDRIYATVTDTMGYLKSTPAREAAPELLEALVEARRMLLHYGTKDAGGIQRIDAAIAKAEGQS